MYKTEAQKLKYEKIWNLYTKANNIFFINGQFTTRFNKKHYVVAKFEVEQKNNIDRYYLRFADRKRLVVGNYNELMNGHQDIITALKPRVRELRKFLKNEDKYGRL